MTYRDALSDDEKRALITCVGAAATVEPLRPVEESARDKLCAALASHPTPDGEAKAPWMQTSLSTVLRHFENEANAADELALNEPGNTPRRRRYEVERDTYRYVLEQIREATPDGPASPPSETEEAPARERIEGLPRFTGAEAGKRGGLYVELPVTLDALTPGLNVRLGPASPVLGDEETTNDAHGYSRRIAAKYGGCSKCGEAVPPVLGDEERELLREIARRIDEALDRGALFVSFAAVRVDAECLRKLAQGEERDA
jgi:hypothetical protein